MKYDTLIAFEAALLVYLRRRLGPVVVALLRRDPADRFGRAFNRHAGAVDAAFIERYYSQSLAAVAAKVAAGSVADVPALFKLMDEVLGMNARRDGGRSYRRANPRLALRRAGAASAGVAGAALPLFTSGVDADHFPGRDGDPAAPALRRELFPVLLAEARWLGPLRVRVFRAVREFEAKAGTEYGAFAAVGRLAVRDERGRVVRVRRAGGASPGEAAPPAAVVRQVRKLYREACAHVESRAALRGHRVKPLV